MKPVNFFAKPSMLCLSVLLLAACAVAKKDVPVVTTASAAAAASVYGDVIARPGQSEVVIENAIPATLTIFVDGRVEGTVKGKNKARIVVPDGNHYIKVQRMDKGGETSKDVQFYTQAKRFFFKAASSNQKSVYLTRENAYDITAPNTAGPAGQDPNNVPLSETALGKDKAAMFGRLDAAAPVQPTAPPPSSTASSPAPVAAAPSAPSVGVSAAPAPAVIPAGEKLPIAVYVTGDRSDSERKALGTKLLSALHTSGKYTAIERSEDFLAQIDLEHMKQRGGSVDDKQISQLGKQFGVRYVCVANIAEAFGAYQVSARIIDVETAVVVAVGDSDSQLRNMDDLDSVSFRVVKALMR